MGVIVYVCELSVVYVLIQTSLCALIAAYCSLYRFWFHTVAETDSRSCNAVLYIEGTERAYADVFHDAFRPHQIEGAVTQSVGADIGGVEVSRRIAYMIG